MSAHPSPPTPLHPVEKGDFVIYSDSDCVVINKPAGMPSQGAGSALEAVCKLFPEIAIASENPLEGGLVHRLDTGTSGCLMFARTPEAYKRLREAFSKNQIEKTYVALVEGEIKEPCVIDFPIAHHPKNKAKMLAVTPKNKYFRGHPRSARTEITPIENLTLNPSPPAPLHPVERGVQTLVRIRIEGGRRHQIRVHLAAIGHPLVGDVLYGAKPDAEHNWHVLHAESITLPNGLCVKSEQKL